MENKGNMELSNSYGFYKNGRRVSFVKATSEQSLDEATFIEKGSAQAFYHSLFENDRDNSHTMNSKRDEAGFACEVCQIYIPNSKKINHFKSMTHLLSSQHISNKFQPHLLKPKSLGYRVLSQYGWSPQGDTAGLGLENQGRRAPVRAFRVKNDTIGLGTKIDLEKVAVNKCRKGKRQCQIQHSKDVRLKEALIKHFSSN
ncbi:RNA-binding protein, G-patch type, human GPANK1 ortholog [Schizosaccharomyces pombe]|uniref:Uncharacterized protein C1604.16c n=1 Tax=Schizosaccharomyces pombe (strain 972 / ATCC 24843) TaxID=284812 RepID=YG0G_SCHPO|nr:putative G-patch type RNA-binding protein [Schizosaccharomyces pombe]O94728.1 RecName: Full=Uncharacterized protein C1604.16c [Schizosaccharomyces pombe 972h-]CAA22349.1 RNA-binding protein, G-patch type (predicted) [Schizosaccharomyces pombe]|eukprot:NP_596624.1 putative G-patch type RNA-binding protein [Schizosaccharomyces pombe]